MDTNTNVVQKNEENATSSQEVKTGAETASTQQQVDYEALLAQKDAEIAKTRAEKDNYKRGLLVAKGKLPEEDEDSSETQEQMVRRITREELMNTKEAQLQAEKDEIQKASMKRIKELELALKNRGQITTNSGQGSNQEKPEVNTDSYFSKEQLAALKAKGYDDKKIETLKQNMHKVNEMPKI